MKIDFVGERDVFFKEIIGLRDVFRLAKDRQVVSFNKVWEPHVINGDTFILATARVLGLEVSFYHIDTITHETAARKLIKNKFFCAKQI